MPPRPKKKRNKEMAAYAQARAYYNRWCKDKFDQLNQPTAEEGFWYICTRLLWRRRLTEKRAAEILMRAVDDAHNYRELAKSFPDLYKP